MGSNGFDGSHKSGGENIWVYDLKQKKKIRSIQPETASFSVQVLNSVPRLVAVTNVNMGLDIFNAEGDLQRTLALGDIAMPLILHASGE